MSEIFYNEDIQSKDDKISDLNLRVSQLSLDLEEKERAIKGFIEVICDLNNENKRRKNDTQWYMNRCDDYRAALFDIDKVVAKANNIPKEIKDEIVEIIERF